ncbi:MAG: C45 family peptidase [Paludibacteraceae bacterium]|nr:C45 family peptidase [Paludibacteraceae bacterium]
MQSVSASVPVIKISGSWLEMGRQYARQAEPYLLHISDYIDCHLADDSLRKSNVEKIADKLFDSFPDYLQTFMQGMAEVSQLNLDSLKKVNAIEYIIFDFGCSSLAAGRAYTVDSKLIFGRNYDYPVMKPLNQDMVVTVFHPTSGKSFATIGYAGEIYAVNGINEDGLFVELNNGSPSAGYTGFFDRQPVTTLLVELLMQASNTAEAEFFLRNHPADEAYIIGLADPFEARTCEYCRSGLRRGDISQPNGLAIAANHFINNDWPYMTPDDEHSWNSITRTCNMLQLAELHKGHIYINLMKTLMSTPVEDGGPFHDLTVYQLVVIPQERAFHLRVIDANNWNFILPFA